MREISASSTAVLTPPVSLEGARNYSNGQGQKRQNVVTRILNLFKSVRPGSDITKFQLPPQFNWPKSQLQIYGESVYCSNEDLLGKCAEGGSAVERLAAVVAWTISTTRPAIFGKVPYNPVLGETHHVSWENLNVLLEQVSHHPPVTALHATNEVKKLETTWWLHPVPRFWGTSAEATMHGRRELKLLQHGETYEMNHPNLLMRFLPRPSAEWVGNVVIRCKETGLQANLSYKRKSLFGLRGSDARVTGKIIRCLPSPGEDLYDLEGNWNQTVTQREISSGRTNVLYDAKAVVSNLKTPIVQNPQGLAPTESAVIWGEVSESILQKDWKKATEAKICVEEKQRNLEKEREREGRTWISSREDGEWEALHSSRCVPQAPIIIP